MIHLIDLYYIFSFYELVLFKLLVCLTIYIKYLHYIYFKKSIILAVCENYIFKLNLSAFL